MNDINKKQKYKKKYIGKEFEEELRRYYETDVISHKLGKIVLDMVDGLSHNPKFINYSWIDDMRGDALIKIMKALERKNYDFDAGFPPFAYFNTIAWRAFLTRMRIEKDKNDGDDSYKEFIFREFYSEIGGYDNSSEDSKKIENYVCFIEEKDTTDDEIKEILKRMYNKKGRKNKKVAEIDEFVEKEYESDIIEEECEIEKNNKEYFYENTEK
jgi:DNA-directed RNA polymerase specialized sigma24 family protein